jgi:uncharacterized membrane protein
MIHELFGEVFTEFPSLHPLIVHFPIVLLLLAPAFQLGGIVFRKPDWFQAAAWLAVAAAISAYLASHQFHAEPWSISGAARETFERHELFAAYTLWASLITVGLKGLEIISRERWRRVLRVLVLVAMLLSAGAVSVTGHLGAKLTHVFKIEAD